MRLADHLARLDLLFTNAAEAAALVGPGAPAELARRLVAKGVGGVVLGQGAAGLALADDTDSLSLEALAVPVVDVTGAGDALAAAVLAARLAGLDLAAAGRIGRLASALAVASDEAVPKDFGIPALRDLALRLDSEAHVQLARL
jgi:sugar/nucleoside kinase (ribokinase family)